MVRKPQTPKSSHLTVTNNLEDDVEYKEFIKRFRRPDLEETKVRLIGYEETINILKNKIETLLTSKSNKQRFALITGPPGTGKTTVVRKLAEQPKLTFFYLKASWMLERQFGNPESRIRLLLDEAIQKAPSLVFIDEIDLICSEKRSQNDTRDRVFNVLLDKLEGLNSMSAQVLVLAATNCPDTLDPKIRKSGYFSQEIKFTLPKQKDRVEFLKNITQEYKNDLNQEQIEQIADSSHCYSYSDLSEICDNAVETCKKSNGGEILLNHSSIRLAQSKFKPLAIKSITTPCPPLRWEDIGGVEDVKKKLQVSVIWPLKYRDKFSKLGARSKKKGAIFYGPPGCSKTMLAQALATESGYNFIAVKGPELFTKWVGDSEAAVRRLYRNAREIAPCIIFFDEIDGFTPERSENSGSSVGEKVVTMLLNELNDIGPLDDVFTIAATNRPERVDRALLRPGRLSPAIYIPLPSEEDRREIFKVHMRSMAYKSDDETLIDKLAAKTRGYSGAEIADVCLTAVDLALCESLENKLIEWRHLEEALEKVRPTTRAEDLEAYQKFQERSLKFGNETSMISQPLTRHRSFSLSRLMYSLRLKQRVGK